MIKTIAKWCAKVALEYLPDVATWAVEQATAKTADSEKAQDVLEVIQIVANDAANLAKVMSDGKVTAEEKAAIRARASALADDIKAFL